MTQVASHVLKRQKAAVRREVRARRDALGAEERDTMSRRIADRLLAMPELGAAATVMAFWSFGSEVDTRPVMDGVRRTGARVALPRIEGREIVPVVYTPGDPLAEAPFGAAHPAEGEVLADTDVDVIVTPGVAFDLRGFRVGYGGGFYDRFFRRTRPDAFRVAVAFEIQVVSAVPHGRADLPVHAVVTEERTLRLPAAGPP